MEAVTEPKRIIPRIDDVLMAGELTRIREEHEILTDAVAHWVILIRKLVEQVEGSNYTDRHDHPLENNVHYQALKDSVSE